MSYGEILEFVLEAVISFNQGKNVFDYSYMAAFGDKYDEQKVVVNNVLQKAYTLTNYKDTHSIIKNYLVNRIKSFIIYQ